MTLFAAFIWGLVLGAIAGILIVAAVIRMAERID